MKIIRSISKIKKELSRKKRKGPTIGLIPTMGYLHEGHASLVKRARQDNDLVVVSIFVNPAQFGPNEDYMEYPRNLREDAVLCKNEGVDYVDLKKAIEIQKSNKPVWLTEKLVWLGNIPKSNGFELKKPFKKIKIGSEEVDDYMEDEVALAYKGNKGLFIISACSHRGICNIIEYAKRICKEDRIFDVIGGFHLMDPEKELLDKTVQYFSDINPTNLHACHCTDLKSKIALSKVANLQEVGVGLSLEYK